MQQTTNYNLNIIERSDNILDSVDALGQNATTIDSALTDKINSTDIATAISSTSTNSEVAGAKAVYDATDKSVITIVNSANKEIRTTGGWTAYQVGLNTVYYQSGSKFTLDTTDGSIKIGAGVSRVKATLNYALLGSSAETGVGIRRYSSADGTWTTSRPTSNYTNSAWFPNSFSTITDVQENDKISMWFNTHTNGTITVNAYGTALTVEELSTGSNN